MQKGLMASFVLILLLGFVTSDLLTWSAKLKENLAFSGHRCGQ